MNGSSSVKDDPGGQVEPIAEREIGMIERATEAAWEALSTADPHAYKTPLMPLEHWSEEADGMVPVSPAGCNFDGELDLHAVVRAVIAALREPTEAQYEALSATGLMWRELDSKTVWHTYIDAALSGAQGEARASTGTPDEP